MRDFLASKSRLRTAIFPALKTGEYDSHCGVFCDTRRVCSEESLANGTQISAKERKKQVRKRAQKGAKEHRKIANNQRAENGGLDLSWLIFAFWGAPIFRPEATKPFKISILGPLDRKSGRPQQAKINHDGSNPPFSAL